MFEYYNNLNRFNEQYLDIYNFLLKIADDGYNEHFHWGRFEWMMGHTMLDENMLDKIAIFRNKDNNIEGLVTYDTKYKDRTYILHSISDKRLLKNMVEYVLYSEGNNATIKVNSKDTSLCEILQEYNFSKKCKEESIIQINLNRDLSYKIPDSFFISSPDFINDNWKYQLVLHKGFKHEGIPSLWEERYFKSTPNSNKSLKVFALNEEEYCTHCGVWYTHGKTAYIEPVVTIPQHRKKGLGKAVIYEAINRAKALGAERAIVLSEQEFYFRIGFEKSSEFFSWTK